MLLDSSTIVELGTGLKHKEMLLLLYVLWESNKKKKKEEEEWKNFFLEEKIKNIIIMLINLAGFSHLHTHHY